MKLLLDTHVVLWWASGNTRLGEDARVMISEPANDILVSVVTLWEILVKVRAGRLEAKIAEVEQSLDQDGFGRLSITSAHLTALAILPVYHRDPFDHLLIAQAIAEDATLVSYDRAMDLYPVRLLGADRI